MLVITASLARWEEFRLHLRTGLRHELEACDVKEALLQTAVYAGVPAANTAFHIAAEELDARRRAAGSAPGSPMTKGPPARTSKWTLWVVAVSCALHVTEEYSPAGRSGPVRHSGS